MSEKHTITINGREYDAVTGLAVLSTPTAETTAAPIAARQERTNPATHSHSVHSTVQRSQTLNRRIAQKPAQVRPQAQPAAAVQRQSVARSAAITKFASHPSTTQRSQKRMMSDIAPQPHPAALRARKVQAATVANAHPAIAEKAAPKPSQVIKQEAISQALNHNDQKPAHKKHAQHKQSRSPRPFSIATAGLALLLLGGYFTYINMPSLSVRVAAAQAGINASYPEYRPDGYSLRGTVAYKEGEVSMQFGANAGPQNFTVTQAKSSYDSVAVLDNHVKPASGDQYTTYNERGLTIYTYGSNAAWVNGGILYTINGDAPLSGEQIRRIATSL